MYYEETVDEDESVVPMQYRRSMHAMHNFVPSNPFRATIRIHPSMNDNSTINTNNALVTGNVDQDALELVEQISRECVACSPVSFPTTPFSRAHVMNQSSEKVEMLIFAARDLLRLEAQSTSRDEYSRNAAKEAQQNGQFAVFDPRQASNGIVLGCGYHCASKIGNGLCSCCRSMMPIRPKTYVYVEFSITVSGNQVPSLGVGLAPPDCPLNVMVGSWSRSLGVYADGQILIGSRWFQSLSSAKLSAGSTVGMLVHYEDIDDSVGSNNTQEGSTIKDCNGVFTCSVNINGKHINYSPETYAAMQDITSLGPQLYPTVSLFSEGTRVWCRFCEADIVYRSRDSIGAPKGAKIYCLDGSLLLSEEDK